MARFHEAWCPSCNDFTIQGPLAGAALIFGVSRRTMQNWRNKGHVHVNRTPAGRPAACLCSGCDRPRERERCDGLQAARARPDL